MKTRLAAACLTLLAATSCGDVYGLGKLVLWDLTLSIFADPGKWLDNWKGLAYGAYRLVEALALLSTPFGQALMMTNDSLKRRTEETYSVVLGFDTLKEKGVARWLGQLTGEILLGKGLAKLGSTIKGASKLDDMANSEWIRQTGSPGSTTTKQGSPVIFQVLGEHDGIRMRIVVEPGGEGVISIHPYTK